MRLPSIVAVVVSSLSAGWAAPARATEPQRCTYTVGDYSTKIRDRLDALKSDAFADAYDTYVNDLERLKLEIDTQEEQALAFVNGPCQQYSEDVRQFEQDRANWETSDCVRGPTKDELPTCNERYQLLAARRLTLLDQERRIHATEADLNHRADALEDKGDAVLARAAVVLDPDQVEQALRLYISWLKREGSLDSCQSLVRVADRLGQRVKKQWLFLELLARNLVSGPGPLRKLIRVSGLSPFAFDSTGFKARFRTDLTDNQVRHAVAYMVVGFKFQGSGADLVAKFRDELKGEPQDYWLGVEAGHMGFQLKSGTYDTGNFGSAIKGRICE